MKQLELPLSCTCASGPGCAFCDAVIDRRAQAWRRWNDWAGRIRAYTSGPPAPVRSFELRRGDARFVVMSARGGPLQMYTIGPNGAETFVGMAGDVVAAGAEPFPCNVSYGRKTG